MAQTHTILLVLLLDFERHYRDRFNSYNKGSFHYIENWNETVAIAITDRIKQQVCIVSKSNILPAYNVYCHSDVMYFWDLFTTIPYWWHTCLSLRDKRLLKSKTSGITLELLAYNFVFYVWLSKLSQWRFQGSWSSSTVFVSRGSFSPWSWAHGQMSRGSTAYSNGCH